ncbi:MAG: xanthine dehydrogenase family protein molybdopterin-binding subunit [Planctomycetota bacterium]|nr:xanthine dehydrogenase family protein molybdopterin-binding subunit [Planctomycetota bacterium]
MTAPKDESNGAPTPEREGLEQQLQEGLRLIGKSPRKVDGMAKCTGETMFADDLSLPRMLICKIHRSHVAHARIKSIDTSAAEAMPGVVAVLTGESMPNSFGILPVSQDEHALCIDKVRFVGDPVAAVAAVDEDVAFEAMNAIRVEYEPLDPVFSPAKAIDNDVEPIHDYGDDGNVHKRVSMQFGDVDQALADADEVAEDVFYYEGNTHLPMEQHATLAVREADGRLTVWSSTQTPHYLHRAMSKVLEMPPSRVRIVACPNGGGFGGKSDPFNHEIVVAKLAMLTGRPVKVTLTREEVFYCHRGRHAVLMRARTGFKKDGSITGMHFESLLDGGAYGSYGVASTYYTGALQTVTYQVPTYRFDGVRSFTNKPPGGPKRGHGTPQPRFAVEVQLDKMAERLGLDPAEMRLKTLQPPYSNTANWLAIGSMGLGPCIEKVVEGSGWKDKHRKLPRGKGIGIACSSYICGAGLPIYWNAMPHSGVTVQLDRGGGVAAFCGATDIGQGSDTVLATCVAEILGVDLEDVRIVVADTAITPVDLGSYSSRVTLMMGNAAIQAAERAREVVAKAVSKHMGIPAVRLRFADNRIFDVQDPEQGITFAEGVALGEARFGTIAAAGSYSPPRTPGKYRGAGVGPSPAYSYSAAVVEVDVDEETGEIEVEKIWIGHDIGQSINEMLVIGQVEGGVYMGLGEALMEEMAYRPNRFGVHKIPSMLEYKSPTTKEMPPVVTYLVEDPDPNGPFGAKEVGQGPLLPVMPAIANAVYDAVGVRVDEVPLSPEKVLKAIESKDKRYGPKRFPDLRITETMRVKTEAEGGDGTAPRPPRKPKSEKKEVASS